MPAVEGQHQTHHTAEVLCQVLHNVGRLGHRDIVQECRIEAAIDYKGAANRTVLVTCGGPELPSNYVLGNSDARGRYI